MSKVNNKCEELRIKGTHKTINKMRDNTTHRQVIDTIQEANCKFIPSEESMLDFDLLCALSLKHNYRRFYQVLYTFKSNRSNSYIMLNSSHCYNHSYIF